MFILMVWFGVGAILALSTVIQWVLDGCHVHEGPDRYYYLKGMALNAVARLLLGPLMFTMMIRMGAPILPRRRPALYKEIK